MIGIYQEQRPHTTAQQCLDCPRAHPADTDDGDTRIAQGGKTRHTVET